MSIRHRVHRVLYVPLDDRPCNVSHVQLLAKMVDFELAMPPTEMLGHYTQPGAADAISQWLIKEAADTPVDCAVLSLDMLAYGGLVASRSTDVRTQTALDRLGVLADLRKRLPESTIYAFNAIMRLSITATSDATAAHWQLLREYSELQGRVEALGEDEDAARLEELTREIPAPLLGKYEACRDRNHHVNARAVEATTDGAIDYLVLCQEDAAQYGPHVKEQEQLRQLIRRHGIERRAQIHPGADEMGQTLFTRFLHQHMEKVPRAYVMYANPKDAGNIARFEDRPYTDTLRGQMQTVGVELSDNPATADFVLAINPPANGTRADHADGDALKKRTAQAKEFFANIGRTAGDRRIAVCDVAFPNGAEDCFVEAMLAQDLPLKRLLTFSAWNTAANSTGSALAHASLRLIALQDKGAFDLANLLVDLSPMRYLQLLDTLIDSERAHIALLLYHFADDWLYQTRVRPQVTEHAVTMLRASIFDLAESCGRVQGMVSDQMVRAISDIWTTYFLGKQSVLIGPREAATSLALAELEETRVTLPWGRLFEVDLNLKFGVELVADQ